jgi:hypothetical protein
MTTTTQYYGAEIQNVQVQVSQYLIPTTGDPKVVLFVFNQKVLSDTFTVKYSQSASTPIDLSTIEVNLNFKPLFVQLGQGGPSVNDPYVYVRNELPFSYTTSDIRVYDANALEKTKAISNITTSIAGNLMEVTCVYSLILAAGVTTIIAKEDT